MDRRTAMNQGLGAAVLLPTSGHTPYKQWVVYRKRRLLIGTSRSDGPTYPLGLEVAEVLMDHLPAAKARASRAPDPWRLASLLGTAQFDVAILSLANAAALFEGRPPFAEFGGVPLGVLFSLGGHLLVARSDLPARHAYLVSQTLVEHGMDIPGAAPADRVESPLPLHPGTLALAQGRPLPPKPADLEPVAATTEDKN